MELHKLLDVPSNWSTEMGEVEIDINSSTGVSIRFQLMGIFRNITRITRVQNPFLYHRYQLRKEEYKARHISFFEKTLLHATSAAKVNSILCDNLDWRLVNRYKFGRGVSFSPDAIYANKQSSRSNGYHRAMLVTKVLIGNSHSASQSILPQNGYDTTTGNNEKVFVKYYDDEFYPEYVVYYNL